MRRIALACVAVAAALAACDAATDSQDGDGETRRPRAIRQGPRPLLIRCRSENEQIRRTADFLKAAGAELRLPVHAGAVLVPTNKAAQAFAAGLRDLGLAAAVVRAGRLKLDSRAVKVMTIHSAKGLEFPVVAVARVDRDQLPFLWGGAVQGGEDRPGGRGAPAVHGGHVPGHAPPGGGLQRRPAIDVCA